jgi:hypothetical protein
MPYLLLEQRNLSVHLWIMHEYLFLNLSRYKGSIYVGRFRESAHKKTPIK